VSEIWLFRVFGAKNDGAREKFSKSGLAPLEFCVAQLQNGSFRSDTI